MIKNIPDIPINFFLQWLDDNDYEIKKYSDSDIWYSGTQEILGEFMETIMNNKPSMGEVSDGFHTFNELYEHRVILFIALCKTLYDLHPSTHFKHGISMWRSLLHSDGSAWPGWFIMGLGSAPGHQITYHLPIDKWEATNFADTLDQAPEYDGHTSNDVLERLKAYFL